MSFRHVKMCETCVKAQVTRIYKKGCQLDDRKLYSFYGLKWFLSGFGVVFASDIMVWFACALNL